MSAYLSNEMSTRQVRTSTDAQTTANFDEDAPLDQTLVDAAPLEAASGVNSEFVKQADREFDSALEAAQAGLVVAFDFDADDPELRAKVDTASDTTDRSFEENHADSIQGVAAELVVQTYLRELGFDCEDTEHWEKKNGDLVVVESGTSIEVKARDLDSAYASGFDDFPIRFSGFEADLGILVLVDSEDGKAVIVGWEHAEELAAFTHAYSPSDFFNDDSGVEGTFDRWVYPFSRTHSINTLPAVLSN